MFEKDATSHTGHRFVVIGGGAGGLELVSTLGKKLGRKGKAEIMLFDATATHIWKPLLHEIAAGSLNSTDDEVSYMAHGHWSHYTFYQGKVDKIMPSEKKISVAPSTNEKGETYLLRREFSYDTLMIAVGSQVNDFGISGVKKYCHALDHREQADAFHKILLQKCFNLESKLEKNETECLKIAIAGAGATGVELAAELYGAVGRLSDYGLKRLNPNTHIEITIVDAANRILPALPERIVEKVMQQFSKMRIKVLTSEFISEVIEEGFKTKSGLFIQADLMVWATGIKAPDFLTNLSGIEKNASNQIVVNPYLQSVSDSNIYAIGDCAACTMENGNLVPPRAQAAHQQATRLAKNLIRKLQNKPPAPYRYVDYGSLINMSRYSTVGSLMGNLVGKVSGAVLVEGVIARLIYLSLYKLHQWKVHGMVRTTLMTIANILTRRLRSRMKLH